MHRLDPLFRFSSVAIVGATDSSGYGRGPYRVLTELGFQGQVYPVNPRHQEVHGLHAYPDVASLPGPIDAAMIVVNRELVLPAVAACADQGAKAVTVIAAGFAEAGERGRARQAELAALARERDLLLIGPNCFGVASVQTRCGLFTGTGLADARPGNVGVISNSGGLVNEILSYGNARGIGFSHLASIGNEAVLTAADLLDYYVDDPSTDVVLAILESIRDPALFVAAAERAAAARKPIVVLKVGASAKAAQAAVTHTGALSGSDAVANALFRQKGITRVYDMDDLIEMGALLAGAIPLLRRRPLEKVGVIEISGGAREVICDTAFLAGVELPDLSPAAAAAIEPHLALGGKASNPLDSGLNWVSPDKDVLYPLVLRTFAGEPDLDVIVSSFTPPRVGELGPLRRRVDELLAARAAHPDRLFAVLSRASDQFTPEWTRTIVDENLVYLEGYGRGLRALGRMAAYSRFLRTHDAAGEAPAGAPPPEPSIPLSAGRGALNEVEAKDILRAAGLPVVATAWARSADEAAALAEQLGYPVAAKVISPQILHKSDVGGVRLGLADSAAVRQAFADLQAVAAAVPEAEFQGVAIQPMAAPGLELVLGAHRDPQFGPVVLFGLGGIFVEVLEDVALRVAPLREVDAREMLDEIRGRALLDGVRGQPPVDRAALVAALLRLSELMLREPAIDSIDLNPVFGYPDGILAVDARIVLRGE